MIEEYICTDLASECGVGEVTAEGVRHSRCEHGHLTLGCIEILDDAAARRFGKPKGKYITISFPDIRHMEKETYDSLCEMLAQQIKEMMVGLCPKAETVLVAGLGNRRIAADAVGPQTVDRITVTRHLKSLDPSLFEKVGQISVAAMAPGVMGDTGMEAAEVIGRSAEAVAADVVLAVDALAARQVDRLGCTVQLSDNGIAPGSGVGNRRMALSKGTLGVPVIAIGVPTVVNSATLVRDALTAAGYEEIEPSLREVLESGRSFFVTPKDSDAQVDALCDLLATALDLALERA